MRILITNDDGIDSPGIAALVEAMLADHEPFVVAPSENRSGVSHAITTNEAITIERREGGRVAHYACSGTPADCVFLGSTVLSSRPDLVISGINWGPNLADDVNYSGTVAGAIEAALLDIPAIAVSLAAEHDRASDLQWGAAAEIARRALVELAANGFDPQYYWNLNVPNLPLARIRGTALTRLGRKRICGRVVGEERDGSTSYFRAWESPFETDRDREGTDIAAVHGGFASLTPLVLDRTARALLSA
ncbi:MAG TPA: 5'/3'-nucleotidase SurE [Verrucomicrobiae bacterium]|nr:5'/3'-nucleotidase SurE [Verrucomicrobiae bacterium]